jgi:hypothetical protein
MKPAAIFTFARIILIGLLIWAFFPHSYNYYIILRWSVFIVSTYGIWRSIQEKEYYFAFVHLAIAVVFNPFSPLNFQRSTWHIIDGLAAFFFFLSIFVIDSGPFDKFSESKAGKIVGSSIITLFALGFVLLGVWLLWETGQRLIESIKLHNDSQQTVATITDVTQHTDSAEIAPGHERYFEVYNIDYTFKTEDGKIFEGSTELFSKPEGDTINVQYEKSNPNNNHASEGRDSSLGDVIFNTILMGGIGGLIIFSAFDSIRKRIKELWQIKNSPVKEIS